jgi:hypothetical protein
VKRSDGIAEDNKVRILMAWGKELGGCFSWALFLAEVYTAIIVTVKERKKIKRPFVMDN